MLAPLPWLGYRARHSVLRVVAVPFISATLTTAIPWSAGAQAADLPRVAVIGSVRRSRDGAVPCVRAERAEERAIHAARRRAHRSGSLNEYAGADT